MSNVFNWPVDLPDTCVVARLSFSYDAKAGRFKHVTYELRPRHGAVSLQRFFQERIEPAILDICPSGTRRKESGCKIQTRAISRSFRYVTTPWRERIHWLRSLLPPFVEVTFEEELDDPKLPSIGIWHHDPNFKRIVSLYRAISGMEGISIDAVEDVAARIEMIMSHRDTNTDALIKTIRAGLRTFGSHPVQIEVLDTRRSGFAE